MRTIPVEEAQAGDVLAEPLVDEQGRTLLPRGARLSAAVISRLRGWGISRLSIEGEDPDAVDAERLLGNLEFRFSDLEGDELMMQIKAIARSHLLKKR